METVKRTEIDFSEHELIITEQEGLLIHHLKKPNTVIDNIKYINTNGILAVTGDYSNWIFCREFHPTPDGYCSDGYWKEKLKINSCQEPSEYDSEETQKEIEEMLNDPDRNWSEEDKEYLEELLRNVDDELNYTHKAYREQPEDWDYESIPFVKTIKPQFLFILDGFEEICRRLKEQKEKSDNVRG